MAKKTTRQLQRRYKSLEIEAEGERWHLEVWANPPVRVYRDVEATQNDGELWAVLGRYGLVRSWDLVGFDGEPIPLPQENPDGYGELTPELLQAVLTAVLRAPLPNQESPSGSGSTS